MKRIIFILALSLSSLFLLSGCGFIADGPFGWFYTHSKTAVSTGTAASGEKEGKACIYSYFGMITVGDASVSAAKRRAGIAEIHTVDRENLSVMGSYTRQCTVVTGI